MKQRKVHFDIFRLILIVIPCLMFLPELLGYSQFAGWDVTRLNLPLKWFDVQSLRDGVLPVWNNYMYAGMPQIGESETGIFYPGNILLHLPGNFFYLAGLTYICHFIMAGLFCDLWLRGRGTGKMTAFFGSVLFQTAPFLLFHVTSMALLQSVVWFPLMLWLLDRSIEKIEIFKRRNYTIGLIILGGILFNAGNAQIVTYMFILSVFYVIGHIYSEKSDRKIRIYRGGAALGFFLGGAVVFGIPLILYVTDFIDATVRSNPSKSFYFLGTWLTPMRLASGFYFPAYGTEFETAHWASSIYYVGLLACILAILRIFGIKLNWKKDAPLIVMGAIALFLAFAMYNPLWHVLIKLPLFDKFRYIGRFAVGVLVALIGLSGAQISSMETRENLYVSMSRMKWVAGIIGVLLVIFLVTQARSEAMVLGSIVLLADIVLTAMVIGGIRNFSRSPILRNSLLGLYVIFHLVLMFPVGRLATMRVDDFQRSMEFFSHLERSDGFPPRLLVIDVQKFYEMDLLKFNRWTPQEYLPDLCAGNTSVFCGAQALDPYTPLMPENWHQVVRVELRDAFENVDESGILDSESAEKLQAIGADYVVTSGNVREIPGYTLVDIDLSDSFSEDARMFRMIKEQPRAYMINDPSGLSVDSVEFTPNGAIFDVSVDHDGSCVFEISYLPHLNAYVDGQKIETTTDAMGLFNLLSLTDGSHEVEFRYETF